MDVDNLSGEIERHTQRHAMYDGINIHKHIDHIEI